MPCHFVFSSQAKTIPVSMSVESINARRFRAIQSRLNARNSWHTAHAEGSAKVAFVKSIPK